MVRMSAVDSASRDPVALARHAVLALAHREQAVVAPEVEARLCEHTPPGTASRLDPLDVRLALDDLEATGQLRRIRTRSPLAPREVPVLTPAVSDDPDRRQAIAEHKRDLYARYLSWTDGPGAPIPAAAEQVVHASFQVAARSGYRIGATPPSDVVVFVPPDAPDRPVLMPVEVRNTREWLMPHSRGLYQLLTKATRIQVAERAVPMVPMFVCRRAHPQLLAMGRDLGFVVVESRREFVLPSVAETAVAEVRATLGLTDLTRSDEPDPLMVSRFEQIVPTMTAALVSRWQRTALTTIPLRFADLLAEGSLAGRRRVLREVRDVADDSGLLTSPTRW